MTALISQPAPTPAAAPQMTPEQMLRIPDDGKLYELVDGQLVEKEMSDVAELVINNLNEELVLWARQTRLGRSFVEATFQCFPDAPEMFRRPDVAYITLSRLAGYAWGRGHIMIAPDLAVEVVSPHDEVYELDRKIADYFRAGVRRIWVINPEQQTVRVHRAPGDLSEFVGAAELVDEEILPGFRCSLATLFARPSATSV